MSGTSSSESSRRKSATRLDSESLRWTEGLCATSTRHHETLAELHAMLLRVAAFELGRRRDALGSITGPEFDDLTQQSADDALMNILAKVSLFRGASRFTTWAGVQVRDLRGRRQGRPPRVAPPAALNDMPIDVLAVKLDSNRNAVYKNLFDARRKLRACLGAAGHPLASTEESA